MGSASRDSNWVHFWNHWFHCDPFHGRPFSFPLFYSLVIKSNSNTELTCCKHLSIHCPTGSKLNILLGKCFHIFQAFLFSHYFQHIGKPIIRISIHSHLPFPLGIKKVCVGFRCFSGGNQVGVISRDVKDHVYSRPVSLRISENFRDKLPL